MRKSQNESRLVWEFFQSANHGIFVDVGANHPIEGNQTWFLEQQGWNGVLIEPNPNLGHLLREQRPKSKTFEVVAGSPAQVGETELYISKVSGHSTPNPGYDNIFTRKVRVPVRTLNSILQESGLTNIDFLSLDVEEMELDVLDGLDLKKWKPRLILIEDFCYNRRKRVYLRKHGYKLVRRTGYNNWYVPRESQHSLFSASSPTELFHLARKIWISGPIIGARRAFRRWRKKRKH
jgi:FkbM family methyltransferase